MVPRRHRSLGLALAGERGQASLLMLGLIAVLVAGTLVLFGFGQALGARGKHQRAADLGAVSGFHWPYMLAPEPGACRAERAGTLAIEGNRRAARQFLGLFGAHG